MMDFVSQRRLPLAWPALLPFCLLSALPADANPTGGTVTSGSATFSSSGNAYNINQTSINAIINWQSFNVGAGETTTFNQPTASSVTWNQINQGSPSQILGNINAIGYVVLQNANGFYIGGQAAVTAHGLVMTTASTPAINFGGGGPWSFSAPPVSAKIVNYGQINITGGGTAYLIASDIENHGTISAPGGNIGLYAGETVLVSTSPNGNGLSAEVTLPQGSVDNEGHLIADMGSIAAQAQMVNQNGVVQANSVKDVNGTIELVASDSLNLGANSVISAKGDSTVTTPSSGGSIQLQSGNSFSDAAGSVINVSGGTQGGNGGQISVSAPQMSALNSTLDGLAAVGYSGGALSLNTTDIGFNSGSGLALNPGTFGLGFSKINLGASDAITLDAPWVVASYGNIPTEVSLVAGNNITLNAGSGIEANAGKISLNAPTVNQEGTLQANSVGGAAGSISVDASQSLNLGVNSVISAQGDSTAATSSGGSVQLQSGSSFSDQAGSVINVSGGTQGGNGGQISISAPQMSALNSALSGQAAAGYAGGSVSIDTENITGTLAQDIAQDVSAVSAGFSQIDLQAADAIELSSHLTLAPEAGVFGSVSLAAGDSITMDPGSEIEADAGRISLNAPGVDLSGTLQADSIGGANGAVEVNAGQSLNLEAGSVISAQGQPNLSTASPGGFVVLHSGGSFSDTAQSTINVAGGTGAGGGQNGIIEVFGNNIAASTDLKGTYGTPYALLINPSSANDPNGVTLSTAGTSGENLNMAALQNYSEICLYSMELASIWQLSDANAPTTLSLSAMNNIILDGTAGITAANNWNLNLTAGTSLPVNYQAAHNSDGIYLYGSSIQTENGNVNLWAANEVQVGWSGSSAGTGIANSGGGGIMTGYDPDTFSVMSGGGGSVSVTALYGDVNTGSSQNGYVFKKTAPYYSVNSSLGGIGTAAGGNVNISAGGDVISYLPQSGDSGEDAGTGAFGSTLGNVTINAGGNIYGHYVLANGVGTITAGANVGSVPNSGIGSGFALSLIDGTWNVNAPNGSIYLQEVRNPNGVFNTAGTSKTNKGYHLFNYGANATVNLDAGIGVELTDQNLPRPGDNISSEIPALYAPILNIIAGSGGVVLDGNVTLFPSPDQNLSITTTDGGSLSGTLAVGATVLPELLMSDSALTRFIPTQADPNPFSATDIGTLADEPVASDSDPVAINISGDMENLDLVTTKQTQITVGQNMTGCSFSGQNLNPKDVTSITVGGQIFNQSPYSFVYNVDIPNVPAQYLPPGVANSWDAIFLIALNPGAQIAVPSLSLVPLNQQINYVLASSGASLFGTSLTGNTSGYNGQLYNPNPGFIYNPTTGQLGYGGQMTGATLSKLTSGTVTVLVLNSAGMPETYVSGGVTYFKTTTINYTWDPASLAQLASETTGAPSPGASQGGYIVGGPGTFDVNAGSIALGNTYGILTEGANDQTSSGTRYQDLASITPVGATLNVTVSGDLDLLTSTIASFGGGDVNVTSTGGSMDLGNPDLGGGSSAFNHGIYTSGGGDVNVTALGDINIDGSRIATFNGGNIFVESMEGNVDVGSGGNELNWVYYEYVNPLTHQASKYGEQVFGSGILAYTLLSGAGTAEQGYPPAGVPVATVPGNITVETPQGSISSSVGGIRQQTLNGNFPTGPTINLYAGTANPPGDWTSKEAPLYIGNVDLGQAGVIGGNVNVEATGSFTGLIFSSGNTTVQISQSFTGQVLGGGNVAVSATSVVGTIAGVGGVSVTGASSANLLGQSVSANGSAAKSTLGTSATATSSAQSAAQQASSQAQQQVATDASGQNDNSKKKDTQIRKVGHVTVILAGRS